MDATVSPVGRSPRVIALRGPHREMGLTHGRLLGREIRELLSEVERRVFRRVRPVTGFGLRVLARSLAAALNVRVPAHFREELEGLSAGSGVDYADLLLLNCLDDILNMLRRFSPRASSLACSSFAILGGKTADGLVLHGRNLDYHFHGTPIDDGGAVARVLLRHALLFVYQPPGKAPFASISWPGQVGTPTALSAEGISLGSLTSYMPGTTPFGIPSMMLYRRIAEEATSLSEAGAILRSTRRTIPNNVLLSSGRENSAAIFEITPDTVREIHPDNGVLVAANHFQDPSLAQRQEPWLLKHSVVRRERLFGLCSRDGSTAEDAMGFLADTTCPQDRTSSPMSMVANAGTAVSVLFRPVERSLWIGVAEEPPASRGQFVRLALDDLLEGRGTGPLTTTNCGDS